jgi:hypothetical protein
VRTDQMVFPMLNNTATEEAFILVEQMRSGRIVNQYGEVVKTHKFTANPPPFTDQSIINHGLKTLSIPESFKDSPILVLYTIEAAVKLNHLGFTNVTVATKDACSETEKITNYLGYKYLKEENLNNMNFTYTFMNPAFATSIKSLELAKKITTDKVLYIGPSRDFEKTKMLTDLEYYEPLGDKAFAEQITTAMAVYNINGAPMTKVKFGNGQCEDVKDLKVIPAINNYEEWCFASNVVEKGLPGYHAQIGKLEFSKAKKDPLGTLCIFTVGQENSSDWGNHEYIPKEQLHLTKGKGKHKLVVSKTGSIGKIGALKYAGPDVVCGFGTYFIEFTSKDEVLKVIEYIKDEPVTKLVKGLKTNTVVNGQRLWSAIPKMEYKDQWI